MTIYLDTDKTAEVLVDAEVSYLEVGEAISESSLTTPAQQLLVTLSSEGVSLGSAAVDVGSTDNQVAIALASLSPRTEPYNITVQAVLANSTLYSTSTNFSYLPYPDSYGSVARLDNLYGGTYAQRGKNSSWLEIYPYTYYVQWSLYWDANVSTLNDFSSQGYNMVSTIHPLFWGRQTTHMDTCVPPSDSYCADGYPRRCFVPVGPVSALSRPRR